MSVGIVYSAEYEKACSRSPKYKNRFSQTMALIKAYGLSRQMNRIPPLHFSDSSETVTEYLTRFHLLEYVDTVRELSENFENNNADSSKAEFVERMDEFGLLFDCPGFSGLFEYASACVAGTMAATKALLAGRCRVAINWAGGWHHAKRSTASGFCYFNDIGTSIMHVLAVKPGSRILYVDLDLHHGDGVEEAFWYADHVVTFSVHHAAAGFFPGTGGSPDHPTGFGRGRFSAFNFPMAEGATDANFVDFVSPFLQRLTSEASFDFLIVQLGADSLASDPHKIFNLTVSASGAYIHILRQLLALSIPTLMLGGGGYHFADTCRLWALATWQALKVVDPSTPDISDDLPYHGELDQYGPDFCLETSPSCRENRNTEASLNQTLYSLYSQLENYLAFAKENRCGSTAK